MRKEYDFSKGKRGTIVPQRGKTRISIYIDNAVLDAFRTLAEENGTGYQTMMNQALREHLTQSTRPLTKRELREVIREEMPRVLRELTKSSNTCVKEKARKRRSS